MPAERVINNLHCEHTGKWLSLTGLAKYNSAKDRYELSIAVCAPSLKKLPTIAYSDTAWELDFFHRAVRSWVGCVEYVDEQAESAEDALRIMAAIIHKIRSGTGFRDLLPKAHYIPVCPFCGSPLNEVTPMALDCECDIKTLPAFNGKDNTDVDVFPLADVTDSKAVEDIYFYCVECDGRNPAIYSLKDLKAFGVFKKDDPT